MSSGLFGVIMGSSILNARSTKTVDWVGPLTTQTRLTQKMWKIQFDSEGGCFDMNNLTSILETILRQNGGWIVLVMLIIAIAAIAIVAIIILKEGTKSLGERIADSVDNNINRKSAIRLKELDVRREELRIHKMMANANISSVTTINDLVKTNIAQRSDSNANNNANNPNP